MLIHVMPIFPEEVPIIFSIAKKEFAAIGAIVDVVIGVWREVHKRVGK
jgi:hypothetical protein